MTQCALVEKGQPEPWVSYECQGYPEESSWFLVEFQSACGRVAANRCRASSDRLPGSAW